MDMVLPPAGVWVFQLWGLPTLAPPSGLLALPGHQTAIRDDWGVFSASPLPWTYQGTRRPYGTIGAFSRLPPCHGPTRAPDGHTGRLGRFLGFPLAVDPPGHQTAIRDDWGVFSASPLPWTHQGTRRPYGTIGAFSRLPPCHGPTRAPDGHTGRLGRFLGFPLAMDPPGHQTAIRDDWGVLSP